jgi:hypothetical protein
MVFSGGGCYYGVLNVLDPTIQYDENGKVISAFRLATTDQQRVDDINQRNEVQNVHIAYNEFRELNEVIVVETVESTQAPESGILDVTGVDDPDFCDLRNIETFPDDCAVEAGYNISQPTEEPIKMFGSIEESDQEPEPSSLRSPVDGPKGQSIQAGAKEPKDTKEAVPQKSKARDAVPPATVDKMEPSGVPSGEDRYLAPISGVTASEATPLFRAITRKNWQGVLYYLRSGSFRFSPLSSPGKEDVVKQAQTWVSKKDQDGTELWRQLPLHAAVCFGAPMIVIEKLIQVYPEALRSPDCHHNLPLHLAFIFDAHDTVTAHLMTAFPASIHAMNRQGLQPIQCSKEISSETFQSNAELFGALSDYTRAIAENDPDRLIEQLQDVRSQLKAVNDTLFSASPPRKPEAIKEYLLSPETRIRRITADDYSPAAFIREIGIAAGMCATAPVFDPLENAGTLIEPAAPQPDQSDSKQAGLVAIANEPPVSAPEKQTCRVMEYCQKTKTWKEV